MRKFRMLGSTLLLAALAVGRASLAQELLLPVPLPPEILEPKDPTPIAPDVVSARNLGLKTLVDLASRGAPERFGFKTPPAFGEVVARAPLQEALVQVSGLKTFDPAKDPLTLVSVLDRFTFPLTIGTEVQSSLTVAKAASGTWKAVSFGSPNLIRAAMSALLKARTVLRPGSTQMLLLLGGGAKLMIVRVTGLNQFFLGAYGLRPVGPPLAKDLYLVPMFDVPRFGFTKGIPIPAGGVFSRLKQEAIAHNGQPT